MSNCCASDADGMAETKLLDLFCGAGGAAMGYFRAGFTEIVGVDIKPQPHYPFTFIQADALTFPVNGFHAIHASPPCQGYSAGRYWVRGHANALEHPDFIATVRERMNGGLWVIENVVGAPLRDPLMLCGSMFAMKIAKGYLRRHRLFETNCAMPSPPECAHTGTAVGIYGHGAGGLYGHRKASASEARELLGIDWMNRDEMNEAIPPAYTEWIGRQLLAAINRPARESEREARWLS